jgi:hypothetical protein
MRSGTKNRKVVRAGPRPHPEDNTVCGFEIESIQKYPQRAVLSMPEHVAGLQFGAVLLLDANAALSGELGVGLNGIQRFVSGFTWEQVEQRWNFTRTQTPVVLRSPFAMP